MAQTLQNQITYAKSMNGIVTLSDGGGTEITNGTIISNDISGNNITSSSFSTNDLVLPRKNTALIPSLGSTIDLDLLIQNFYFDPATRFLRLYADDTTYIFEADLLSNAYSIFANTFNLTTNNAVINASGLLFQNTPITFSSSSMSFGNMLPTSTLTPTLSTQLITKSYGDATYATLASLTGYATLSGANVFNGTNTFNTNLPTSTLTPTLSTQLITKSFADTTYATLASLAGYATLSGSNVFTGINSFNTNLPTSTLTPTLSTQLITKSFGDTTYARLAVANSFTELNTFRKGILPCRGTGANPESDIQIGKNQLQYRQATSQYNISIGDLSLVGATGATFQQYNTGSRNIALGHEALNRLDLGNDNIFIGYQAGKDCGSAPLHSPGITPNRCIAIGTYSQLGNLYMADSISIGYNSLRNASGPAAGNVMMGSNVGNGLTFQGNCTFIGSNCAPTVNDNAVVAIGYQALGAATGTFNSGTAIGWQAGYSNAGGQGGTYIGAEAGYTNTTGSYNTFIGLKAGRSNSGFGTLSVTICIGYNSKAVSSNECVFGGETLSEQAQLTIPNKHRIAMNQSPTGVTITLAFRTNENVLITDNTTTTINLPTPAGTQNIGAKFNIMRQSATANNITINAPAGQTIGVHNSSGTYTTSSTYIFTQAENQVILLCISNTGNSWLVVNNNVNNNVKNISYNSTSFNGIFGTGTITGVSNNNLLIGKAARVDAGIDNIIIGQQTGSALLSAPNDNIIIGKQGLNSCSGFCNANVMLGQNNGKSLLDSTDNTFIGNYISPTQTGILYSTALGSNAVLPNNAIYSTAIGYGATVTASNQIMLGRATETVRVAGTLQVSSVSAISSTITINNDIIHKKYYLSMVNPTVLTGTSPLTMSAPIYEYVQVNLASGIILLPLSSDVEIGTVIRFRRITTMTGAITLEIQSGSGQGILARNGVTPVSTTTFLAASVTYGSVVFLSSNLWAIND